jgi:acetate kinase
LPGTRLTVTDIARHEQYSREVDASGRGAAVQVLIDSLGEHFDSVAAVGHRVVHGMQYDEPMRITPALLEQLHRIALYDPDHLPLEIELMEALQQRDPQRPQVACFDTAFHRTLPRVAQLLPIPRRYEALGVRRYGFHGLSYAYLLEELARIGGADAARGRIILAHLGNGASMAAVRDGKSVDTTMGFTPAGGLPMGTRPGDLDPGVAWWLMDAGKLNAKQFNHLISHESGLLGVSETSADMSDLLAREAADVRAAEAVALFCYEARKRVGALAAALGGIDVLVFAGGIGENSPIVRARICDSLGFLGVALDEDQNSANAGVISVTGARVSVRVLRTDEESMIARTVCRLLGWSVEAGSDRETGKN